MTSPNRGGPDILYHPGPGSPDFDPTQHIGRDAASLDRKFSGGYPADWCLLPPRTSTSCAICNFASPMPLWAFDASAVERPIRPSRRLFSRSRTSTRDFGISFLSARPRKSSGSNVIKRAGLLLLPSRPPALQARFRTALLSPRVTTPDRRSVFRRSSNCLRWSAMASRATGLLACEVIQQETRSFLADCVQQRDGLPWPALR